MPRSRSAFLIVAREMLARRGDRFWNAGDQRGEEKH